MSQTTITEPQPQASQCSVYYPGYDNSHRITINPKHKTRFGFTLVELSIVLVVIGLIVGGVLVGKDLIEASKIRATISQYSSYKTAVLIFREKYNALPGDMTNATDSWGIAGGTTGSDANCYNVESVGTETCNGTGEGIVRNPPAITVESDVNYLSEEFRFWQHLSNASLIEGKYTGRTDSTTDNLARTFGKNTPISKINMGAVRAYYMLFVDSSYYAERGYGFNAFGFGKITAKINYSIDTKIDNGNPVWGKVFAPKSDATWALGCTTSTVAATAQYDINNNPSTCPLLISWE